MKTLEKANRNLLNKLRSKMEVTKERFSELKDRSIKIIQSKEQKKKMLKNEQSFRTCFIIKGLMFVSSKSRKERRKSKKLKKY